MARRGIVGHRPNRRRWLTKPDAPAPDLVGRLFDPTDAAVATRGRHTMHAVLADVIAPRPLPGSVCRERSCVSLRHSRGTTNSQRSRPMTR